MAMVQWRQTEPPVRLTQRQFVTVVLYASGASAQQTAEIPGVQFGTLHKARRRIRSKFACAGLAAGTRTDLERALHAHPTLVAYADGTERLVRPYVPAPQRPGASTGHHTAASASASHHELTRHRPGPLGVLTCSP